MLLHKLAGPQDLTFGSALFFRCSTTPSLTWTRLDESAGVMGEDLRKYTFDAMAAVGPDLYITGLTICKLHPSALDEDGARRVSLVMLW